MDKDKVYGTLAINEEGALSKALPVGTINAHGKMKMGDGSWKHVKKDKGPKKEKVAQRKSDAFDDGLLPKVDMTPFEDLTVEQRKSRNFREENNVRQLDDETHRRIRIMGRSQLDNVEESITDFRHALANKNHYEGEIALRLQQSNDKRDLIDLMEGIHEDAKKDRFLWPEQYAKDPRLAAIAESEDMVEFLSSPDYKKLQIESMSSSETKEDITARIKRSVDRSKNEIRILQTDIEKNPIKKK